RGQNNTAMAPPWDRNQLGLRPARESRATVLDYEINGSSSDRMGSTTEKADPTSGVLLTLISPPNASTIRFASARPRPDPGPARDESPRQKGSNTWCRWSCSMPSPE